MGETQALARQRSAEARAGRPLDVLPAHLIPGGGPLSSMTMWWVLSLSKAERAVEGGWGSLVLRKSMPVVFGPGSLEENGCFFLVLPLSKVMGYKEV